MAVTFKNQLNFLRETMKLRDILEIEKENKNIIHVFKTGVLWNCYERSALYFNNNIEVKRIFSRQLSNVIDNIVFLVIPDKDISRIQRIAVDKDFEIQVVDSKYFKILNVKHKAGFTKWKKQSINVNKLNSISNNKPHVTSKEGLQVSVFNLSTLILKQIQNYNKVYRFSLGDRLSNLAIEASELSFASCNYKELSQILTKIQIDIRLSFQLHQINERRWFTLNSSLEEIKKYVNAVIEKSKSHC